MSDQVIPFTDGTTSQALDRVGQQVLAKLQYAAGVAEKNTQHALSIAQEAATKLRIAEDKLARVELEVWNYKERAERAEGWLQRISQEIDQSFPASAEQERQAYAPKRPVNTRR
jgi:hypothetical protein